MFFLILNDSITINLTISPTSGADALCHTQRNSVAHRLTFTPLSWLEETKKEEICGGLTGSSSDV